MKCENFIDFGSTKNEVLGFLSREYESGKNSLANNRCCIATTVLFHTKRIQWSIRDFQSFTKHKRITLPVLSALNEIPNLYATLIKNSEPSKTVALEMRLDDKYRNFFLRCAVSVANVPKDIDKYSASVEDEILFKNDAKVWNFEPFLDFSTLEGYFEHTDGVLYLQLDFAFSSEDQVHHSERRDRTPAFLQTKVRFRDEEGFSTAAEDEHCVVTLRAGDRTFKVHKSILMARSQVFSAMFENDMLEKRTGVVDVPDVEPHVLERMLSFLTAVLWRTFQGMTWKSCTPLPASTKYSL